METLGASIVEVSRCEGNSVLSLFATLKIFHKNVQTLKEELQKISRRKRYRCIKIRREAPPCQVIEWLEGVEKIECEVEGIEHETQLLLEADPIDDRFGPGCILDSNMLRKYHLSKTAAKKRDEMKKVTKESCNLPIPIEDRKPSDIVVEHISAPSLVGQKAPQILKHHMELLAVKEITRIDVYGRELFDMVISVPVSNDLDIKEAQSRFAEKLKEYTIRIGPSSCDSIYLPTQHDEKRVILRGVGLLQRGLEGLLCTASSLDLFTCGGVSSLSNIITNKSLCSLPNLKSLTISNCDCITTLLVGETTLPSTLPNLEHGTLSHLDNLATLLDTIVPRGCLGNLKTIKVVGCRLLKNLISFAILRLVPNLEEIKVSECRRMKQVITKDFFETIPKLKTIEVRDMESLRTICSREAGLSALERIVVSNCPRVVKLPFAARDAVTIKEIRGDLKWWRSLKWQVHADKICL
ncbi:hypothetical protein C1H46_025545 [Malus baccata]|uniref:Disease resistance protein At4g27190-like leucine-rich repeats domain-containing protein n=1 Tax=Malus baccata TaxID=106549 RepID=A0A540LQT8_MALBA|nr:hypothetical protein C1H46_025545 [Malus baccata]